MEDEKKYVVYLNNFAGHYDLYLSEFIKETDKTIKIKKIEGLSCSGFTQTLNKRYNKFKIISKDGAIKTIREWEIKKREFDQIEKAHKEYILNIFKD